MSEPVPWADLRRLTPARIGLGRAGNALPTNAQLELRSAHAAARDAVHQRLDVQALAAGLRGLGWGEPVVVASRARDRAEFLRRPDLGRELASSPPWAPAELAVVVADGLSAQAVTAHALPLLHELSALVDRTWSPPVIATQARAALGDHIGAALGVRAVLVLIGERPGLSAPDSLGAYLTYAPTPGRSDAERNCVSNIRPPAGLRYDAAARVIAGLLTASLALGRSGVVLKDRSGLEPTVGSLFGAPTALDSTDISD